jgi:hypothetical protein
MKQGLVQLFVVLTLTLLACKRGPEGPAGPQGPAGPNYVAPYQQGYIKGTIIAQDTFNNRRVRESYNYVYYSQNPCYVDTINSTLTLSITRWGDPTINSLTIRRNFLEYRHHRRHANACQRLRRNLQSKTSRRQHRNGLLSLL